MRNRVPDRRENYVHLFKTEGNTDAYHFLGKIFTSVYRQTPPTRCRVSLMCFFANRFGNRVRIDVDLKVINKQKSGKNGRRVREKVFCALDRVEPKR